MSTDEKRRGKKGSKKRRKRGLSKSAFCPPSSLGHLFQLSGNPANEMLLQRISLHFKSSLPLSLFHCSLALFGESIRTPFRRRYYPNWTLLFTLTTVLPFSAMGKAWNSEVSKTKELSPSLRARASAQVLSSACPHSGCKYWLCLILDCCNSSLGCLVNFWSP